MGKGSNLYFQQQQARQLREMEKHQAALSGQPLRKLSWTERHVLGLKDEPSTESSVPGGLRERAEAEEAARAVREPQEREPEQREPEQREPEETGDGAAVPPAASAGEDASRLEVRGYLIDARWDGQTLTVTADNKVARVALRGKDHKEGPLTLRAAEIESTELKQAGALTNGRLTVRTRDGRTYLLHFQRRANVEFARLYKALPG